MTPHELFADIRNYCITHADESRVRKYARYFTEGYDAYGLSRELLETKVNSLLQRREITMQFILDTCPLLIKTGKYEETSFAILLLNGFAAEFTRNTLEEIGKWFRVGITNWGHTDALCGHFFREFFRKGIITLEDISGWRTAENKYQRRAVPVGMIELLRVTGVKNTMFEFIDPMMEDTERVVHQGLGWFLREAWKRDREMTEDFLLKWKDRAPRLIFQYATEKMQKEERVRFRKKK